MEDPLFHELLLAFDPDLKDWLGIFGYHLQSTLKFSNIYISNVFYPPLLQLTVGDFINTSHWDLVELYIIGITSQPVAQDEIDEYMMKYASSSSASGMDDDDANGDEDDPDAQQDYAAFNTWLDQLSKGEAVPSRPAVSRPPPKDAKPEADAPQVGGSVKSPASGSKDGGPSPDSVASPSEPTCCQLCKAPMTTCNFGC